MVRGIGSMVGANERIAGLILRTKQSPSPLKEVSNAPGVVGKFAYVVEPAI
jgi:hypothetical protein